jgi:ABC-type amino acid transport substrate-binding protein
MRMPLAIVCLVVLAAGCAPEPPAPSESSASAGLATVEPNVLTVCTYTGFAPVSSKDESGEIVGTDITFVRHFAEEHGLGLKFKEADFAGIWERPGRDECDLAAAGIAPLDSRKSAGVVWSAPYFNVQRTLLIRKADAGELHTIADFKGRTIGFTTGSTAEKDTRERAPEGTLFKGYTNQQDPLNDLLGGTIDAFGEGSISNEYLARLHPELAVIDAHEMNPPETFSLPTREAGNLLATLDPWIEAHKAEYAKELD